MRYGPIERHAGLVGKHDGAVGRLALDVRRTRQGVALRPGNSLRHVVPLQRGDEVAVLGVNQRHRADLGAADEGGEHLLVVDHQRALVGHEMLEGRDARLHHLAHVLAHLVVPVGDAHVVRIVGDRVLGTLVPVGKRLHQRLVAVRDAEVDDHRRPARHGRLRATLVIVGGYEPMKGMSRWVWGSMPPGMTKQSAASRELSPLRSSPIALMVSPSTSTSAL